MTFIDSFSQFNMNNFGFCNTSTPISMFTSNMWNSMPVFNFQNTFTLPSFDFSSINLFNNNISWNNNFSFGDTFMRSTSSNKISNKGAISLDGYNQNKGKMLASDALSHKVGFTKRCATYVSNALERTGLSNGSRGHGYQMAGILRKNKNFKEISTSLDYKNLPAGCILVFDRGAQGYNATYGHVEISTGDGRAVSDGVTKNIKKPSAIFMPV